MQYVKNEWIKIWSQKNAWVMLFIIFTIILLFTGISKFFDDPGKTKEQREQENTEQIEQYKGWLSDDPADESNAYFNEEISLMEYRIANDLPSPNKVYFTNQMKTLVTLSITLASIFGVVIAAGIVSSEFSRGTIKMLLTRPVARWKILLSKLVATILYTLTIIISSILFAALLSLILFGTQEVIQVYVTDNGSITHEVFKDSIITFKDATLLIASLLMTIVFAFMIGSLFGSSTIAVGLSLFILLMGQTAVMILAKYEFTKFIWFANDLAFYKDNGSSLMEGVTLNFSIVVNIVYLIIFLAVTFITFMRKDVTA